MQLEDKYKYKILSESNKLVLHSFSVRINIGFFCLDYYRNLPIDNHIHPCLFSFYSLAYPSHISQMDKKNILSHKKHFTNRKKKERKKHKVKFTHLSTRKKFLLHSVIMSLTFNLLHLIWNSGLIKLKIFTFLFFVFFYVGAGGVNHMHRQDLVFCLDSSIEK